MSLNHFTTAELDIDVKSLKIEGTVIGSSGTLTEFVPNFSSPNGDTFNNLRSYYKVNGNHLELFVHGTITMALANTDDLTIFLSNPQGRGFKSPPLTNQYVNGQIGGNNKTQVGFDSDIAISTTPNILTVRFTSTNSTIPQGSLFTFSYNSIVELSQ